MDLRQQWDLEQTAAYIRRWGFKAVALQFPDNALRDAPLIASALQQELGSSSDANVYVMADTTYNPLAVDEVAAQHVNADCVIHYGHASLYPVSHLPALCVLPKAELDIQAACSLLLEQLQSAYAAACTCAVLLLDQAYQHVQGPLQEALQAAYQGPLQLGCAHSAPVELYPPGWTPPGQPAAAAAAAAHAAATDHQPQQPQQQQQAAAAAASGSSATCADARASSELRPAAEGSSSRCSATAPVGGLLWNWPGAAAAGPSLPERPRGDDGEQHEATATTTGPAAAAAGRATGPDQVCSGGSQGQQQPSAAAAASGPGPAPEGCLLLWLGPLSDSRALAHLQLTYSSSPWLLADPASGATQEGLSPDLGRLLKRRYFLVEKTRGAAMVGLLVGTLGTAGYLEVLLELKALAKQAGKKTYTLLMGKPNPAKLANFPEIEVFVLVADPQGLILDSKDYLAPIITPHEALLAFTGKPLELGSYRMDFGALLEAADARTAAAGGASAGGSGGSGRGEPGDRSAASAARQLGGNNRDEDGEGEENEVEQAGGLNGGLGLGVSALTLAAAQGAGQLAGGSSRAGGQVVARSAAEYLTKHRAFQGVETPATGADLKAVGQVQRGRMGRAAVYEGEPSSSS